MGEKRYPTAAPPAAAKVAVHGRRNEFEAADNFVAKSPSKRRRTPPPAIELGRPAEAAGLPVIKASEGPVLVTLGGIQLVAGILMMAFGILATLHEASLASVGAGLWGGAMGAAVGLVGVVAGFKGCYRTSDRISPLAVTVYLALCLVAIGVGNLALVLTATGLLRDSQRTDYFLPLKQEDYGLVQLEDSGHTNWAPVLANIGLLIITSVECLATIAAAFRCYWYVCRCRSRRASASDLSRVRHEPSYRYDSPDITTESYCSSSRSKQKLVRRWLGQQSIVPPPRPSVPFSSPYGPVPPYYMVDGKTIYPSSTFVSYSDYNYMMPSTMESYYPQWPRMSIYPQQQQYSRVQEHEHRPSRARKSPHKKYSIPERPRKISDSTITEEDIDKTYTGLDREIAEEFISVAMEPKRH